MKYQLTYRDYKTEEVDCDGMQTTERFTMFIHIDQVKMASDDPQQPTATPILIVHNDEIRSIRNITPQVAKPLSRIH